ncbi:efflux RND transporter periplasmic adaptor subunit [Novosphingobium sp. BL-8H]|uniref:efflux RND transporter periplasmic adaptor subunit n=1 Tax=Novosphingobium sp. BL-8H TaxID=3127640 RepID=UPI0037582574
MSAGRLASVAALLALAACSGGEKQEGAATPSVLVTLARPVRGTLPATITAYGSAAPSEAGMVTVSMAQPGQLTSLAVTPGTAVRAGQVLGTFAVAPTARSAYLQAVSAVKAAEQQRRSTVDLLSQHLATSDQLAQADKALSDARTTLAGLAAEGAGASTHTLTAPFAGVVSSVTAAPGDRTQPGAPIMTIARAGGILVTVGIDPADRGRVAAGQKAEMKRLSGGTGVPGQVVRVDQMLNAKTRMVDVDLSFPTGALLPGEGMEVAIHTADVAGWVVPHAAVVTAGGPARVFQDMGGKAKAVPVQIRLSTPQGDVVEGAIDAGRPIIVEGAYQVNDGDAVRRGQ